MAMVVVFPVCLPMHATMRLFVSDRSFCWYSKGVKWRTVFAKNGGLCFICSSASGVSVGIFV